MQNFKQSKWMYELIQWADENNVPEFTYLTEEILDEDDNIIQTLKIPFGLPRNEDLLLNLKELNLSGHNFTEIPEQVKYLTNLKLLNFSKDISDTEWPAFEDADRSNVLTSIPNWIAELINLEELNLSNNRIRYIPCELGSLKKLKKLYLHANGVALIHPNIAKLESLEVLWLYGGCFRALPKTISLLKKAKMLKTDYKPSGSLLELASKVLTLVKDDNFDEILGVTKLVDSFDYRDTLAAYFDAFSYILHFGAKEKSLSTQPKYWIEYTDIKKIVSQLPNLKQFWLDGLSGSMYAPIDLIDNGIWFEAVCDESKRYEVKKIEIDCTSLKPWSSESFSGGLGNMLSILDMWEEYDTHVLS